MLHKKQILVVEDEVSVGRMLKARLEDMGYRVDWIVPTGEEAIEIARKTRPDLILMDIKLAGNIDGIEAGNRIRTNSTIPIIYLTSHVSDSYIKRAKLTEPLAYMLKPVNSVSLRTTIEMAFARVEVEQRLSESERRYRALVETQVELVCRCTGEGALTYANDSYCIYFGIKKEDLSRATAGLPSLRKSLGDLKPDRPLPDGSGSVRTYETKDTDAMGKTRFQQWTEVSLFDETGKPLEIQAVGRDITELKEVEADRLHRTEERFRAVFESAADSIFILDKRMRYTHANAASLNLLGLSESQVVGLRPQDVFGPETGASLSRIFSRVLKGVSAQYEQIRQISGVMLTFSESATPLRDFNGKVIGLCCIGRNVTEQKRVASCEHDENENYLSAVMRETMSLAQAASDSDGTVCLLGESGSGKDRLARWIHDNSKRKSGPFVPINCAVLPESLAESELFGHERGAFTGAAVQKRGLLELAEGGTILLNEIGELSTSLQAKLLSFIDTKSFLRVGGAKRIMVDSRLIVATHRRLEEEVEQGRFMSPLFHRINVFPIVVPPLRDRLEDIPVLCRELLQLLNCDIPLTMRPAMDIDHYKSLCNYHWPGNVRELRNVLERSLMLWKGGKFFLQLPTTQTTTIDWVFSVDGLESQPLSEIVSKMLASVCQEVVNRYKGNKSKAAKSLGISRDALYRHLRKNSLMVVSDTPRSHLS